MGRQGEKESMVSFSEALGITKGMDNVAEVERIRLVAVEAKGVEEVEGLVGISVFGANVVDFLSFCKASNGVSETKKLKLVVPKLWKRLSNEVFDRALLEFN
ncbi:hypothetical protein CCACVL1_25369 [Corchorus capsularis]|uniref:Uncharacterized protein n=1 Tax=Corchorus capsularis TaxID=210143 RepID=A0A1R3GL51_COCAP|nr:hypothetical protein CCACVL1_25369 [Corchorus capsularis]